MLFDPNTIPEARMPARAQSPSKAQNLLEDYRMAQQRRFDLEAQLRAECALITDLERKLLRQLKDGEELRHRGVTVARVKRNLFFEWDA